MSVVSATGGPIDVGLRDQRLAVDASARGDAGAVESAARTPAPAERRNNCLFEEPWWLDAVAPGTWDAVEIQDGGQVQARLTFGVGRLLGRTALRQPPLTQTLGPWYHDTQGKSATRLAREKDLAQQLIAKLPPHGFFSINFHRSVSNWLPYHWAGFQAAPRITYVLTLGGGEQPLWAGLQENIRREIRKARKQVEVLTTDDVDLFLDLNRKTFERQALDLPHSPHIVRALDVACARRQARRIYLARDGHGRLHAGLYVVHDDRCCYYLMGGGDPALRNSGAGSLLMWQAITDASSTSREFDFEGSMGEPIERFFRSFGAAQTTFFNLRRSDRLVGAVEGLRTAWRSLARRA